MYIVLTHDTGHSFINSRISVTIVVHFLAPDCGLIYFRRCRTENNPCFNYCDLIHTQVRSIAQPSLSPILPPLLISSLLYLSCPLFSSSHFFSSHCIRLSLCSLLISSSSLSILPIPLFLLTLLFLHTICTFVFCLCTICSCHLH